MHTDDSTSGGIGEECPTYESLMNDTSKVEWNWIESEIEQFSELYWRS